MTVSEKGHPTPDNINRTKKRKKSHADSLYSRTVKNLLHNANTSWSLYLSCKLFDELSLDGNGEMYHATCAALPVGVTDRANWMTAIFIVPWGYNEEKCLTLEISMGSGSDKLAGLTLYQKANLHYSNLPNRVFRLLLLLVPDLVMQNEDVFLIETTKYFCNSLRISISNRCY